MPARKFTAASTEHIDLAIGALASFGGTDHSLALICRPTSFAASRCFFSAGAALATGYHLQHNTAGRLTFLCNNSGSLSTTAMTVNQWGLIGVTKGTGSVVPRFHFYDYLSNTWTHEAGSVGIGNSSAPATRAAFGVTGAVTVPFDGDIAVGAVWSATLTDAQYENLAFDVNSWFVAQPKALWLLDQDPVAQKVIDMAGGGANQSAITGTSLSASSVPVFSRGAPMVQL